MSSLIFRSTYSRPVFLAGSGVRAAGAQELLRELSERSDIPVLTSMNAVDLMNGDRRIGFVGTHGDRVANCIVSECDLLVAIGVRLGIRQVGRVPEKFAPSAHIIRADIDEHELARPVHEDDEHYLMDAREFLLRLLEEDVPNFSDWMGRCLAARDLLDGIDETEGNRAVRALSDLLPESPMVTVDVGQNQCWCAQSLLLKGNGGRVMIAGGYGSMGCALPFAIGAAVYDGTRPVFCVTGDGGMQMNIQELETVRREHLPVKIIVLNNSVLGKIYETQRSDLNGRYAQTSAEGGYSVPAFERIAQAYEIKAARLESYQELSSYSNWLDNDEPCLLNVMMSSDSWLEPKVNWSTGEMLPRLEAEGEARAILRGIQC